RYISKNNKEFELAEIEKHDLVLLVLEICLVPTAINELIAKDVFAAIDQEELKSYISDMVGLQLLLTEKDPNIIGPDYFKRIGFEEVGKRMQYIIAESAVENGTVDLVPFRFIPELVEILRNLAVKPKSSSLEKFIVAFSSKFERREVPLMLALDPEIGIGYDELEQSGASENFVRQFAGRPVNEADIDLKTFNNNISSLIEGKAPQRVIMINELIPGKRSSLLPLPNTFSVMARRSGNEIFIDHIGGISANTLNGRFTIASSEMLEISRKNALIESNANPNILFFDVAYIAEANVDNINRRENVYPQHLSILNYDTDKEPLTLNYVMISIRGGEVILRSVKHNKRMVPKLASAYNYSRSDLSLFRLLCDLQHQGIQSHLSFSIEKQLPDRMYYPRLQYKNLVVSPEMWRVKHEDVRQLLKEEDQIESLRTYLKHKNITQHFRTGLSDQTLCFDSAADEDMLSFMQYASKQQDMLLEEITLPSDSTVTDRDQNPYLTQFILTLEHDQKIYRDLTSSSINEASLKQFFPPGSEWIYFEIFCHPQRANNILIHYIAGLIDQYSSEIRNWFFIRYDQGGSHIRLRIQLLNQSSYQQIVAAFHSMINEEMEAGLVSDLQIKTYRREMERYSHKLILAVETHFRADSDLIVGFLKSYPEDMYKYRFSINIALEVGNKGFTSSELLALIRHVSDSFVKEHQLDSKDFKKLNSHYQEFTRTMDPDADEPLKVSIDEMAKSFINLLKATENIDQKNAMYADLLHMHVNRLFSDHQRTHEMVIYYFLLKQLQRAKAYKPN
ncbi:MAG: hypothetical protein EOO89_10895, partial [Pedobacter sp.]